MHCIIPKITKNTPNEILPFTTILVNGILSDLLNIIIQVKHLPELKQVKVKS